MNLNKIFKITDSVKSLVLPSIGTKLTKDSEDFIDSLKEFNVNAQKPVFWHKECTVVITGDSYDVNRAFIKYQHWKESLN